MSHRHRQSRLKQPRVRRSRHTHVFPILALLAAIATTVVTFAQPGDRSLRSLGDAVEVNPNFDIRTFKVDPRWEGDEAAAAFMSRMSPAASLRSDLAAARIAGVAELEKAYKGLAIEDNAALGGTEVVSVEPGSGFLTPATGDRVGALRRFLSANADAYGISATQAAELELVADYMNPAGNMGYVEFEQTFNGIPVFQGLIRGGFTAKGELARTTGVLATGVEASALPTTGVVTAARAVSLAAATVGWQVAEAALAQKAVAGAKVTFDRATMADDAKAWPVYFPLAPGVARLAWATEVWGDPDAFLTVIDAETGAMLFRKNMTNYQTQSATYNVYTSDSPAPSSPTPALPGANFQATVVARQNVALIGNEAPNTFNNLGWMTDGTNLTDGNNVEAGMDLVWPDGVDSTVTGAARVFNFAYNPAPGNPAPGDSPTLANFRSGEAVSMFYWVNRFHDATYLLGFNEVSRNFQNDNFGRGGLGADRVSAEGQDSSGTNNANFSTPADGGRGRMQMYLFTAGATVDRSSGVDQDVVIHELAHGLSNRLHNNGSGLGTTMSGGMGEGWSDFYARALLADASENVNGVYSMGGWVTYEIGAGYTDNYYYGIRRFPYAVRSATGGPLNRPFNPLTFADIDPAQINLTDGAYPRGLVGSTTAFQVHNVGEVWATALHEVRARFVTRLGFATGNQRFLQFVTDGMKLDPVNPTLLQGRDSIIAAANAGGGTVADVADIWAGFAARGMGVLAQVVNATTGTVIENFSVPGDPVPTFTINDVSLTEGNAGTKTFAFTVNLAGPNASESRVSYVTADGTATNPETPFQSVAAITVNDNAAATPYPSTVNVSGLTGTIQTMAVRLDGITHTYPGDLEVLLVGPGGQNVRLMSDAGGDPNLAAAAITFRDGAPAMPNGGLTPGATYAPTDLTPFGEAMPVPAPAAPYGSTLSAFSGTNPNGTWSLYVADDAAVDTGSIAGFTLLIGTTATSDYTPAVGQLVFPVGTTSLPVNVTVNGDTVPEPNETFFVNLSSPVNGVIGDAQGVGTILNDDGAGTPPTTAADSYTTPFATPLIVAAPGVLSNDTSNGGSGMTAVLVTGAANGAVSLNANGGFTYTPNAGFAGADSFTYRASDSGGPGNVATVSLTVTAGTPPTTAADSYTTPFATPLIVAAPGVLANDTSNGGSGMTAVLVTGAANGAVSLNANGSFTYTPNAGFAGADSFTYRASDSGGPGNVATVSLTVTAGTPTTAADSFSTPYLTALNITAPGVLANDGSNGGGAMTAVLVSDVTHGTLSLSAGGGISYTPDFGFAGIDSFTYRAQTGIGPGNVATVEIEVAAPTTVQPPYNLRVDAVVGNTVTLRWDALAIGPQASTFVLEGGVAPGDVLASIPTGSASPIFTFVAPTGSFFIRMHGQLAADRSPSSNEVPLHVNVPVRALGASQPAGPGERLDARPGVEEHVRRWPGQRADRGRDRLGQHVTPAGAHRALQLHTRAWRHLHVPPPRHERRRGEPVV